MNILKETVISLTCAALLLTSGYKVGKESVQQPPVTLKIDSMDEVKLNAMIAEQSRQESQLSALEQDAQEILTELVKIRNKM